MSKLIHSDLSYKILRILFKVHNELGNGYKEKHYQRVLKRYFSEEGIRFDEQVMVKIRNQKGFVGNYYIDFIIEGKVVLEIKAKQWLARKDILQVLSYLKETGIDLGILATFSKYELKFKRILRGF